MVFLFHPSSFLLHPSYKDGRRAEKSKPEPPQSPSLGGSGADVPETSLAA
jgi:hypothetical protein